MLFTLINFPAQTFTSSPEDPCRRERRLVHILILAATLLLLPLLFKPWIHGNDGVRHYAYCRAFWLQFNFDFNDTFQHYVQAGELQEIRYDSKTGLPGNSQGAGSAVLWSPFFLAGHAIAFLFRAPRDGYSAPYVWMVCLGTVFYCIAGLHLLADVLLRRFGPAASLLTIPAIWLGTPLFFYMYMHPSMSHGCSFFLAALLLWQYERWSDNPLPRHFFLIGLAAGLATAVRLNDAVLTMYPAVFWLRAFWRGLPGNTRRDNNRGIIVAALLVCAGVLAGFFPQMLVWRYMYDAWLSGPRDYQLGKNLTLLSSPHLLELLFSGWRGLFVWCPVLILSALGFLPLLRQKRLSDFGFAVMFLWQSWVLGGWSIWWGAASFGPRFFINLLPGFACGLACLYTCLRAGAPRRALALLTALCVLWNAGLAVQYIGKIIDREKPLTLAEIANNQIYKVPQWLLEHLHLLKPGKRIEAGTNAE